MYETFDAVVHVDVKTCHYANTSDYDGKIPLSLNQTSYFNVSDQINGELPTKYPITRDGKTIEKYCVTYVIQLVYEQISQHIERLIFVCVPNGELHGKYGDEVMARGKGKGRSFRYVYEKRSRIARFETLEGQPPRLDVIHFGNPI